AANGKSISRTGFIRVSEFAGKPRSNETTHKKKSRSMSGLLFCRQIRASEPLDLRLAFQLRTVSSEILLTGTGCQEATILRFLFVRRRSRLIDAVEAHNHIAAIGERQTGESRFVLAFRL